MFIEIIYNRMFKIFITYNSSYSFYMKMFYETK